MKVHTKRPIRKGNAQKAWDHLSASSHWPIQEMFYSRDHIYGPRWVSYHGVHPETGGYCGTGTQPVFAGGCVFHEIESSQLQH